MRKQQLKINSTSLSKYITSMLFKQHDVNSSIIEIKFEEGFNYGNRCKAIIKHSVEDVPVATIDCICKGDMYEMELPNYILNQPGSVSFELNISNSDFSYTTSEISFIVLPVLADAKAPRKTQLLTKGFIR